MLDYGKLADVVLKQIGIPVVLLVTGVVLFAPEGWTAQLGLIELRDRYRMWFGLFFLASLSMALQASLRGIPEVWRRRRARAIAARQKRKLDELLGTLGRDEVQVLLAVYQQGGLTAFPYQWEEKFKEPLGSLQQLGLVERKVSGWFSIPRDYQRALNSILADHRDEAISRRLQNGRRGAV